MNRAIIDELIQFDCNSKKICFFLERILDKSREKKIKSDYKKLYDLLDQGGASKITSNLILKRIVK